MTRWIFGGIALFFAAQLSFPVSAALLQSEVLQNDVAYLRVGEAGKNLADEISAAETTLTVSNKTVGTILDLRFANGDDADAAQMAADLFASKKSLLAILVNSETSGAAEKLALDLRVRHAGLIFGSATAELKPDIAVAVRADDEKIFLQNPYAMTVTNKAALFSATNDLLPFVDHTSEADLVRKRIKDGEDESDASNSPRPEPAQPVIRDPVLARALDLLKALAILHPAHG